MEGATAAQAIMRAETAAFLAEQRREMSQAIAAHMRTANQSGWETSPSTKHERPHAFA